MSNSKKAYYSGVRFAPYDIVKEFLIALVVVSALVVVLALALSSPDVPSLTLKTAALRTPLAFVQGSLNQLDGQSDTAGYGPPYNNTPGVTQNFGFIDPQQWFGVRIPVDAAQTYVLEPLNRTEANDPALASALTSFRSASPSVQTSWENAYNAALGHASVRGSVLTVPSCTCGPLPIMMSRMLALGQSGAMDGLLLTTGHFYQTDYTRSVLFLADAQNPTTGNGAIQTEANKYNLLGETWGVMNETGNYPGQAWLWLYTALYQIPPYSGPWNVLGTGAVIDWSASADLMAVITISTLTLVLLFLPWIPGLNRIPRLVPVYRLIWKDYYRERRAKSASSPVEAGGA